MSTKKYITCLKFTNVIRLATEPFAIKWILPHVKFIVYQKSTNYAQYWFETFVFSYMQIHAIVNSLEVPFFDGISEWLNNTEKNYIAEEFLQSHNQLGLIILYIGSEIYGLEFSSSCDEVNTHYIIIIIYIQIWPNKVFGNVFIFETWRKVYPNKLKGSFFFKLKWTKELFLTFCDDTFLKIE